MKKYSNIPLKERKRNADRCYRHEVVLEEEKRKKEMREIAKMKEAEDDDNKRKT